MNRSFRLLHGYGTELRVHWSFPLGVLWFLWVWQPDSVPAFVRALVLVALLFGSVLLHEIAHVVVARSFGIAAPVIELWPFGGLARLSTQPRPAWQDVLILLAGPLSNLGLALLAMLAGLALGVLPGRWTGYRSELGELQFALDILVLINLSMGIFNLLPALPLDGGQIARRLLASLLGEQTSSTIMAVLGILVGVGMVALASYTGDILLMLFAAAVLLGAFAMLPGVGSRFERWVQQRRDPGLAMLDRGSIDQAIAFYDRKLAQPRHQNNVWFYNNRGWGYAQRKQHREALADYERALAIDPQHQAALLGQGLALQALGEWAAARQPLQQVLEGGNHAYYTRLAREALEQEHSNG